MVLHSRELVVRHKKGGAGVPWSASQLDNLEMVREATHGGGCKKSSRGKEDDGAGEEGRGGQIVDGRTRQSLEGTISLSSRRSSTRGSISSLAGSRPAHLIATRSPFPVFVCFVLAPSPSPSPSCSASLVSGWLLKRFGVFRLVQVEVDRAAGLNDVGMVAWMLTLRTPEYPEGRQVVLIANDITHQVCVFFCVFVRVCVFLALPACLRERGGRELQAAGEGLRFLFVWNLA